jgi:two-component system, NtrC family, sensor histidine kinase HydH
MVSYKLIVWMLLLIALILGGGFLIIAFTYNLQKDTLKQIDVAQQSVDVAQEMEIELIRLRGFTFTYLVDKSAHWLDSINAREIKFIVYLERARHNAKTPEENAIIRQISGLFGNYEQNLKLATHLVKKRDNNQANALLIHSAKDLIDTIHQKCKYLIALNQQAEQTFEFNIAKTNSIILKAMIFLGISGIIAGLLLGWIVSRMLFSPINQLILQVRGAPEGAILEKFKIPKSGELDELADRIKVLLLQINKTQKDLERNKQLLQYSNKYSVLGKVAPTIAHEIRNPLAAIKMLVYSMKEEHGFRGTLKQDFDIISNEIDRMEGFIRNFLRFARPTNQEFMAINPTEILDEVMQLLAPKLKKNAVKLNKTPFSDIGMISGDAGSLKQLFMNLILNAVEVMPAGGELTLNTTLIHIESENPDHIPQGYSSKQFMKILIEDTGPGIPEKILNNLFEPFVKGSEHGIGLGLSISQSIASFHKGWIEASNKPYSTGAIFAIYLPISTEANN